MLTHSPVFSLHNIRFNDVEPKSSREWIDQNFERARVHVQFDDKSPPPLTNWPRHFPRLDQIVAVGYPLFWVFEDESQGWMPIRLPPHLSHVALRLLNRTLGMKYLSWTSFHKLRTAGIIRPKKTAPTFFKNVEQAAKSIASLGYGRFSCMFSPIHLGFISQYIHALSPHLIKGDSQSPLRDIAHNAPYFRYLHHMMHYAVQRAIPEPIKPSYCYFARYNNGAILERHVDRPQCAWNASLMLHSSPDHAAKNVWSISVDVDGKEHRIDHAIGEMIVYRGTELPHWREALTGYNNVSVLFLHFVPNSFDGDLN